jgi:hypothetical protein
MLTDDALCLSTCVRASVEIIAHTSTPSLSFDALRCEAMSFHAPVSPEVGRFNARIWAAGGASKGT